MRYVVLGGGIAGVCCALELVRCLRREQQQQQQRPDSGDAASSQPSPSPGHVVLVSSSSLIKGVREVARLSRLVEEIEVVESPLSSVAEGSGGLLSVRQATATRLDTQHRVLHLSDGSHLPYDKLCIATGALPKELDVPGGRHPAMVSLRDTDSVQDLARRLASCRRVLLLGNGGIALELAGALMGAERGTTGQQAGAAGSCRPEIGPPPGPGRELVWALKHGHIGDAFFDADAAAFLLSRLTRGSAAAEQATCAAAGGPPEERPTGAAAAAASPSLPPPAVSSPEAVTGGCAVKQVVAPPAAAVTRKVAAETAASRAPGAAGHAAGPAWTCELMRSLAEAEAEAGAGAGRGRGRDPGQATAQPAAHAGEADFITVTNSAGGGDGGGALPFRLVLEFSATVEWIQERPPSEASAPGEDSGSGPVPDARGAVVVEGEGADWPAYVRLTNGKARVMGTYAGRCMYGGADELELAAGFNFELFTHVTRFLGAKVVLLGLYNGQRLEAERAEDVVMYSREGEAEDGSGPTFGAVLIGNTDLEE
ncbi:hypothetical protein GPECTOR_1g695 [Gonium pectorale]|uniref:FAD/NAD(P)-binding domain-containing protein n=1 Tax=Gonium pectorale TaxID=33097 RepID=A0A150H3Y7_GONPE|nr:hypothetical protein GPECTOR_1g695 [Gonium pectorale]|eukprot:KXZ56771.1 hypothetical protein GPECTOR_1g695 [Gonium pectorale]